MNINKIIYIYVYINQQHTPISIPVYFNRLHLFSENMPPSKFIPASMYCARVFDHYKEQRSWPLQSRVWTSWSGWNRTFVALRLIEIKNKSKTLLPRTCNPTVRIFYNINHSLLIFLSSSKKHIWFPEYIIPFTASCFTHSFFPLFHTFPILLIDVTT